MVAWKIVDRNHECFWFSDGTDDSAETSRFFSSTREGEGESFDAILAEGKGERRLETEERKVKNRSQPCSGRTAVEASGEEASTTTERSISYSASIAVPEACTFLAMCSALLGEGEGRKEREESERGVATC